MGTGEYGTRRLVSRMPVGSQLNPASTEPGLFEELDAGLAYDSTTLHGSGRVVDLAKGVEVLDVVEHG